MIVDINNPECDVKKLFDDFHITLMNRNSFGLNSVIAWINHNNGNCINIYKEQPIHEWNKIYEVIYEAQKLCDTWITCKFITKSSELYTIMIKDTT
jgi:hypothetical protein